MNYILLAICDCIAYKNDFILFVYSRLHYGSLEIDNFDYKNRILHSAKHITEREE